jgi:hypothetical protein
MTNTPLAYFFSFSPYKAKILARDKYYIIFLKYKSGRKMLSKDEHSSLFRQYDKGKKVLYHWHQFLSGQ